MTFVDNRSSVFSMEQKYSTEFFLHRSFEVVWAAFRVAGVCGRDSFRELLEKRALSFFSEKTDETLQLFEQTITLGYRIGDIAPQNAKVLLREINHLRTQMSEGGKKSDKSGNAIYTVDISDTFSSIPKRQESGNNNESGKSLASPLDDIMQQIEKGFNTNTDESLATFGNDEKQEEIPQNEQKEQKSLATSGKVWQQKSGNASGGSGNHIERKQAILAVLKEKKLCHMSDIIGALPGVSDRTLRYDVKSLIEKNLVERVGSGGPHSFIRLRQKER